MLMFVKGRFGRENFAIYVEMVYSISKKRGLRANILSDPSSLFLSFVSSLNNSLFSHLHLFTSWCDVFGIEAAFQLYSSSCRYFTSFLYKEENVLYYNLYFFLFFTNHLYKVREMVMFPF